MEQDEEYKKLKRDFRKFLRESCGKDKMALEFLINEWENKLPSLIRKYYCQDFPDWTADTICAEDLIRYLVDLSTNEYIISTENAFNTSSCLECFARYLCDLNNISYEEIFEKFHSEHAKEDQWLTEIIETENHLEGAKEETTGVKYQRNKQAVRDCLKFYGCKCFACGDDMGDKYGEHGKGFIHVHHIIPVSQRGGEYVVNGVRDLRPLCPNCHAIVHRKRNEPLSMEELKKILAKT